MTILKEFLDNPSIVADPERLQNFCDFIENVEPPYIQQKDIGALHFILKNIHRTFFEQSFYYDFTPKQHIGSLISKYESKPSTYLKSNSYDYNNIKKTALMIKKGYHFELMREEISSRTSPENISILDEFINKLRKNRDEYQITFEKAQNLFDKPIESLQQIYAIAKKEYEDFKNSKVFTDIPDFFQDAERIYGFTSHHQENRSHEFMLKYLEELTWIKDTELKKKIIISYVKGYSLSLQNSLIAKMKYQHFCNSCYIKTLSLIFDDRACLIEKSVERNKEFIESLKHKRYDPVKDKAEHIAMLKGCDQSMRDRVANFNKNNIDVLSMLNSGFKEESLILNIRKKGLGLSGSFNKEYDITFLFKKLEDEHFSLILSDGKKCSFLNKERFLSEIETKMGREYFFPDIKEPFVIKLEA